MQGLLLATQMGRGGETDLNSVRTFLAGFHKKSLEGKVRISRLPGDRSVKA